MLTVCHCNINSVRLYIVERRLLLNWMEIKQTKKCYIHVLYFIFDIVHEFFTVERTILRRPLQMFLTLKQHLCRNNIT